MRIYYLKIFLFFFLGSSLVFCQQNFKPVQDVNAFKSKLESAAAAITTIKSNFVQEKNLSVLSEKIISKGNFNFKKKDLLRWEYTSPIKYLIVFNNGKIIIKDDEKVSRYDVQSNEAFKKINDIMLLVIQGNILKNKDFSNSFFESEKNYLVTMTPQNTKLKEIFKYINIYFDKKDYNVVRIELVEPSGDFTKIDFKNRKYNESIPDDSFIIK